MIAILRWLSDAALASSIAGDLEEQHRKRATRSPIAAQLWLWRRSIAIVIFLAAARVGKFLARALRGGPLQPGGFGSDLSYSVGILGLIAMSTARRTREMGIRLALGATGAGLVQLLLREQLRAVAAGVVVGSAVSVWAVRFVRAYLYEITPYDPRVWAVAIIVIVATTVIGTLVPSLRASQTDPVKALRVE